MRQEFHDILHFLTIAELGQALLLIFILLVLKRNRPANLFFALFLVIVSMNFLAGYLHSISMIQAGKTVAVISLPGISVLGVLIYFYTSFMTGKLEKFKAENILHFTPYPVLLSIFIYNIYLYGDMANPRPHMKGAIFFILGTGLMVSLAYMAWSFISLRRYSSKITDYFSDYERHNLSWIMKVVTLSFTALLVINTEFWIKYFGIVNRNPWVIVINLLFVIAIIFVTAYYLVNTPEISKENLEMNRTLEEAPTPETGQEKYARRNIDISVQNDYLNMLEKYMEDEKPYLDENISIRELSVKTGIPHHHLSIVINSMLGKNFYTFINEYRVKEAEIILNDPDNVDASIISIAFRAGFNSKSAFNSVFKKITGKTPSQYRESAPLESPLAG